MMATEGPSEATEEEPPDAASRREDSSKPPPPPRHRSSYSPSANKKGNRRCIVHSPTLEELQSQSFSDYVRKVVLPAANRYKIATNASLDEPADNYITPLALTEGMAKIRLPTGFWKEEGIAHDLTGRGPAWQAGTALGDIEIPSPIQQHVRGMAGIYEFTFTDQRATTLAAFRDKADTYRSQLVGCAVDCDYSDDRISALERQFWKRLGPTMPAAQYGADFCGSLFGDDPATGWSLADLDSCLQVLSNVPGVTSPYLYAGMWASVFCAHAEDMDLFSINYLHAGQPKIWYAVSEQDAARFRSLAEFHYAHQMSNCKEFLRHKRSLLSPVILKKAGIPYQTAVQFPGEAVITFPGGYHFGFNAGFNLAEATNFAVPEWIPFGKSARVCLCRPDSVRIDMDRLTSLLELHKKDSETFPKLSWKEWRRQREEEKMRKKKEAEERGALVEALTVLSSAALGVSPTKDSAEKKKTTPEKKPKLSKQQRKNEFWVEVKIPISSNSKICCRRGDKKGGKKRLSGSAEKQQGGIWHLAKPISRKGLPLHSRVLCIVPAVTGGSIGSGDDLGTHEEEEEELCFAGQVVEIADYHVRIHLEGLRKTEDIWMPASSPKLFLDGGRWSDEHEKEGIPALHYWQEADSKKRCIKK